MIWSGAIITIGLISITLQFTYDDSTHSIHPTWKIF